LLRFTRNDVNQKDLLQIGIGLVSCSQKAIIIPIPSLKTVVGMMYESSWRWIHNAKVSMLRMYSNSIFTEGRNFEKYSIFIDLKKLK
jgi:hypothetical protein